MITSRTARMGLSAALVAILIAAIVAASRFAAVGARTTITAYFVNTNGMFVGDEVRILGVPVGKIDRIEPQPQRAKVTFYVEDEFKVPADAKAVILSPNLVTSRAIQLTPAYTSGPVLQNNSVIPLERTAVPVEFDDLRQQLQKLTDTLQPTEPGGVSKLGAFVDSAAGNLRGNGASIRETIIKLSQAFSALGDHSTDLFSTIKDLSIVVSALQSSANLVRQLNVNLAAVTGLLSAGPTQIGTAIADINSVVGDVQSFVADNKDAMGIASDKLASITTALNQSRDDIKQTLHIAPNAFQNFVNIYQPAQGTLTGALAVNNFANPITFICGAIQAASRLNAEQSAKLCVQYLAPIIKNRQYNFLPVGFNGPPVPLGIPPLTALPVTATARPNEITFSEDWMRPDYVPPAAPAPAAPAAPGPGEGGPGPGAAPPSAAPTNPAEGLRGMMAPPGGAK